MSTTNEVLKCKTCGKTLDYNPLEGKEEIICPECNEANAVPKSSAVVPIRQDASAPPTSDTSAHQSENTVSYVSNIFDILTQRGHRLLGVYLLINAIFAAVVLGAFIAHFMHGSEWAFLIGFVVYAIYLFLMLSPLGEGYLRFSCGCRKINRQEDLAIITPIFTKVMERARTLDPGIPEDMQIFISDSPEPNAFALGRKSICVTRGIISNAHVAPPLLEAVLAHEFGHIAHKDTDVLVILTAGNIILDLFFKFLRLMAKVFTIISTFVMALCGAAIQGPRGGTAADSTGGIGYGIGRLIQWILDKLIALWEWLSTICVMRASRKDEFRADEFSFNLGYGNELCEFLDFLDRRSRADEDPGPQDFFAFLAASHPPTSDRIAHLQEMGATFYRER